MTGQEFEQAGTKSIKCRKETPLEIRVANQLGLRRKAETFLRQGKNLVQEAGVNAHSGRYRIISQSEDGQRCVTRLVGFAIGERVQIRYKDKDLPGHQVFDIVVENKFLAKVMATPVEMQKREVSVYPNELTESLDKFIGDPPHVRLEEYADVPWGKITKKRWITFNS